MSRVFLVLLLPLLTLTSGCVERKLLIHTEPDGARFYLDYEDQGTTPVETNFSHYGERFVRIEKQGYQTRLETVQLSPPWYSYFPVNFFSELLLPYTIHDRRERTFQLEAFELPDPGKPSDDDQSRDNLLERAKTLRKSSPDPSLHTEDDG